MRFFKFSLGFIAVVLATVSISFAQTISITSPSSNVTVQEGDDYATQQLGNPWDMSQRRDIGWEENFDGNEGVSGGVWSGTNEVSGGHVFPLFPGFKGGLFAEGLPGDTSLPGLGINTPIESSRYSHLAFKMKHTERSSLAVYWTTYSDSLAEYWTDGSQYGSHYDGFYHWGMAYTLSDWEVYSYDMLASNRFEVGDGSWTGNIITLRIDPSVFSGVGETAQFDWVRLVDPDSAPDLTITWNSNNLSQFSIITIWADDNASGFNGTPIGRIVDGNDPGSYTFPTAILPPGDYYFYITVHNGINGTQTYITRSGYSSRLRVNAAPSAHFTSPSQTSGEDYATAVVGNPWDMDGEADIPNLNRSVWSDVWRQFSNESFNNGVFQATANPPLYEIGNTESDVQFHLNVSSSTPIDTSKYRYLTYRMAVDPTAYPTIVDKVRDGWVSRPVFWNSDVLVDYGRPSAHVVYEGWHTYTIDLWDSSIIEAGFPWLNFSSIRNFRIDPLEVYFHTWFFVDDVKLSAESHATGDQYDITFNISDSDNSSFIASLYYDTDNSGFDGTFISSVSGLSTGSNTYTWDTSALSDGNAYYVYIVLSDGTNTAKFYSDARVVIGDAPVPPPTPDAVPYDYDGDTVSDHIIYRPESSGRFYTRASNYAQATLALRDGTDVGARPIHGDFDGDGKADYATVSNYFGYHLWNITLSGTGTLYQRLWGLESDTVVVADYNGDDKDDVAVYRAGAWYVIYLDGSLLVTTWGTAGDVPVPADYDGDGKADIAVWRASEGNWYVINSQDGSVTVTQWGLPGDVPVQADWFDDDEDDDDNSNNRADFAVFRPADGTWYLRNIITDAISTQQWGLPGDTPLCGDYNGDGKLDFVVFRPGFANWYSHHRNGNGTMTQWGLPIDSIPQ